MKRFEISMFVLSLAGLCLLSGLAVSPAQADFVFGPPVNLKVVIPILDPMKEDVQCLSLDGLEMYIHGGRPGGQGKVDIWVLRRASPHDAWGLPENLGPAVNGPNTDGQPCLSADGLSLYFVSDRSGGYGSMDVYMTTRTSSSAPWGQPVNLGPTVNSSDFDTCPWVSSNGLELYIQSNRPGGYGNYDIYLCRRAKANDPWGHPVNLGPVVNSAYSDANPSLSADGLLLFCNSLRPGGYGAGDIWMTRRTSLSDPWGPPVNLGPNVNGPIFQGVTCVSPDGSALYLCTESGGIWENWQAPITPTVDFNSDGKVDAADLALLVDNWGKNQPSCDMGPFPWGDGVVDERDLRVLIESLVTPRPKALDVPCYVILSWISPSLFNTCDVYWGTSFEAVNSASRTNPQGVLVSQGQTATTYDPPGPLEFSTTYYWRVDFVITDPAPAIYQGPVLKFTTEDFARPVKNIIATASSAQRGMGPEQTVNGSGLDKSDGHSAAGTDMWLSMMGVVPHWIQYECDKVYTLHELWVWNSNQAVEPFIGFGAKTVKIEYSTDGVKWTPLEGVPEFARATGKAGDLHNTTVSFGGVPAKFVKLSIEKGWGTTPSVGLSEVRFFHIPDRSATKP